MTDIVFLAVVAIVALVWWFGWARYAEPDDSRWGGGVPELSGTRGSAGDRWLAGSLGAERAHWLG